MKHKQTALTALLTLLLGAAFLLGCTPVHSAVLPQSETAASPERSPAPVLYQDTAENAAVLTSCDDTGCTETPLLCTVCGEYGCDGSIHCNRQSGAPQNRCEQECPTADTSCVSRNDRCNNNHRNSHHKHH